MVGHPIDRPDSLRQDSFGRTTERFFAEGEEHESREWEDVQVTAEDEDQPRRRGGSIDKVPRQRGAVFALAVLCIGLAAGAAIGGFALFANGNRLGDAMAAVRSRLSGASRDVTAAAPPTAKPQPTTVREATPVPPPVRTPEPLRPAPAPEPLRPTLGPRQATSQAPTPQTSAGRPASKAVASPVELPRQEARTKQAATPPADPEGAERLRQDALAVRRRRHSQSRDNYVWSQELKALVPVSSMPGVQQTPAQAASPPALGYPR